MSAELLRESFEIQGRNFEKAGEVSSEIKVMLRDLCIDAANTRRTVIVAYEGEMNVVMYAQRGTLTLILTDDDVSLEIADEGPGIPDIELALQEGYSTASDEMRELGFGFGMGLPNMKKNSDEFRIESEVGKGTRVFAEGPYGTFTEERRSLRKVLLIAGGIGITPLRALLASIPADPGDITLLYRAVSADDVIFRD